MSAPSKGIYKAILKTTRVNYCKCHCLEMLRMPKHPFSDSSVLEAGGLVGGCIFPNKPDHHSMKTKQGASGVEHVLNCCLRPCHSLPQRRSESRLSASTLAPSQCIWEAADEGPSTWDTDHVLDSDAVLGSWLHLVQP